MILADAGTRTAEELSSAVVNGAWLDALKFVLVVGWFLLTVRCAGLVAEENHRLRLHRSAWSFAVVAGALASLFPLLAIPLFPVGLFFAAGFFVPMLLGYVHMVRNPRVREPEQILTDEHLGRIGRELLAGIGIPIAAPDEDGPLVRLKPPRALRRRAELAPVLGTLEGMLQEAVDTRTSDLQLDVLRDRASVRRRIDGVWGPAAALELDSAAPIADLLPKLAAEETGDARRVQAGSFPIKLGRHNLQVHLTMVSSTARRRTNLRLPTIGGPKKVDELGLGERELADVAGALKQSTGLVVVCGPSNSGRRTTLQAMAASIDQLTRRVLAVDEPARPFDLPNTVDRLVLPLPAPSDPTWGLKQAANVSCDVLLVGRVESPDAAAHVLSISKERLVLAAVDADNVVAGLLKLAELGDGRDGVAERLRVALSQRLPRKLCVDCREPYRPNLESLRRANLARPVGDVLYRARSPQSPVCETCNDTGYVGCAPLFESLTLTTRLRHLLRVGAGERELLLEARKEGAVSPTEAALALLATGVTSADELRRILQSARSEREEP